MRRWKVLSILAKSCGICWRALDEAGTVCSHEAEKALLQEAREIAASQEHSPDSQRIARIILLAA